MDYKTISVVLTDESFDEVAFEAAIEIVRRTDGHLDVFCIGYDPVRYDMMPMGSVPVASVSTTNEAQERAGELATWAEEKLKGEAVKTTVRSCALNSVAFERTIARLLRFSDLIVVAQPYVKGSTQLNTSILEAALFGTGAPVMVVPKDARGFAHDFERPLVMWNESPESLTATRNALLALVKADRTEIVMVDPPAHSPDRSDPGGAMTLMLARHGVKAEVSILSKTMHRVADIICRHATDHHCDLIVMGAYGHSRFRESLIGGVTRDMLESTTLPILMSH